MPLRRQAACFEQLESEPARGSGDLPLPRNVRDTTAGFQVGPDPPVPGVPRIEPVGRAVFLGRREPPDFTT